MTIQTLIPCISTIESTSASSSSSSSSKAAVAQNLTPHLDNASDILPFRVNVLDDDWKDQIIYVAQAVCPFIRPCQELKVTPLGGGLSNELFVVKGTTNNHKEDNNPKSVLVRIHPTNNSDKKLPSIVDRDVENTISAWLSSQNVGPTYYGRFQNGRVEEFYPHHETLSWKDMNRVGPTHIAPIMAQFHALQVPSTVLTCDTIHGNIVNRVQEWMATAQKLCDDGAPSTKRASSLLRQLQEDWKWLEQVIQQPIDDTKTSCSAPVIAAQTFMRQIVFTHMDMQALNLLRDTTVIGPDADNTIKLIDFEYASFNPRAMDIANTFCEHCDMNHIQADYATQYPSDEVQNAFLQSYLGHVQGLSKEVMEYRNHDQFLQAARHEIGRYALVSHISWAIWSIVQSFLSDIDFDYILYARHRRDGYVFMKAKCFGD